MRKSTLCTTLLFVMILLTASVFPAFAADRDTATAEIADAQTELGRLYNEINPSVVFISVKSVRANENTFNFEELSPFIQQYFNLPEDGTEPDQKTKERYTYGSGTGFVWDEDGHIVTNYHVIEGAVEVQVTYHDGIVRNAIVIGEDPDSDLAVLEVEDYEAGLTPVTLGDSNEIEVGEFVAAIGNPFGNTGTITTGIVSALGRSFNLDDDKTSNSHYQIPDMIQTDAAINPGNSGGVLINLDGEVIGVVNSFSSTTYASAGIGYAIPSNLAKRVIPALIKDGKYDHPWIGFSGISLTPTLNAELDFDRDQRGALIQTVIKNSPAEKAGVQGGTKPFSESASVMIDGDVITKINDRRVTGMGDIIAYLASNTSVGEKITLTGIRGGREITFDVTLAARPTVAERTGRTEADSEGQNDKSKGSNAKPWLGATVRDLNSSARTDLGLDDDVTGVLVTSVTSDSPAEDANIFVDDVLTEFDGVKITTVQELIDTLAEYAPGDRVSLTILRDGEEMNLRLTLSVRPGL